MFHGGIIERDILGGRICRVETVDGLETRDRSQAQNGKWDPALSMLHESAIAPALLTLPKVGRSPVTPQRVLGETMEPQVSVPMANGTSPAAVAAADPAEDPLEPSSRFQGFLVLPPYHTSPMARAPRVSFPSIMAPASSSLRITVALCPITCSLKGMAPQLVG